MKCQGTYLIVFDGEVHAPVAFAMRDLHEEPAHQGHADVQVVHLHVGVANQIDVVLFHVAAKLVADVLRLLQRAEVEVVIACPPLVRAV